MTDMNILFLLHSYPKIGGIEVVTKTISGYLNNNHNLYYLSRVFDDSVMQKPSNCFYFKSKDKKESIDYFNYIIDKYKIDVVINQGPFLPYLSILENKDIKRKIKIFSFLHFSPGFEFEMIKYKWMTEKRPIKRLYKRIKTKLRLNTLQYNPGKIRSRYKQLANISSHVIVLSEGYIKTFKDSYKLHDYSNIISIPNPSRYDNKEEINFSNKSKVVLFVGRLELESKRVDRLLDVWKNINNSEGWTLKIVGDGPCRQDLEQKVVSEDIKNVMFLGQQNDIPSFYKEASVIALTSSYEGQSLCFLEGIQFGTIPIAFDVSIGNKEILQPISNDLLITPFDIKEYSDQLNRIINDKDYRKNLFNKTLDESHKYSLESIGMIWEKLLLNK